MGKAQLSRLGGIWSAVFSATSASKACLTAHGRKVIRFQRVSVDHLYMPLNPRTHLKEAIEVWREASDDARLAENVLSRMGTTT